MATGVTITGLRETVRNLERLGVSVEDLKDAFTSIAQEVVQDAGQLVPVKSGALKATIRPARTKNKAVVRAGTAGVPYAAVINYGWPGHNIAATGFLTTPANTDLQAKADQIEDNLRDLIRRHNLT